MTDQIIRQLNALCSLISEGNIGDYLKNLSSGKETHPHDANSGFSFPGESHRFIEFAVQLSGRSLIYLGKTGFLLKKNQMILIDRNTEHGLLIDSHQTEPVIMLWIAATNDTIRPGVSTYSDGRVEKQWALDIIAPGGFLLDSILREAEADLPDKNKAICSYLSTFLILLVRKISFSNKIWDSDRKMGIVRKVQDHILDNISKNITLHELSDLVSISPSYLCRVFKQCTGATVFQYLLDTRIRLASDDLVSSGMTLAEIAEKYGFYDQFHFSKVFKTYTHISPSGYIAAHRKAHPEKAKNQ